jgi:hypothetical protein
MVAMVPPLSHSNNEIKNIMLVNDEQDVLYNFKITLSEEGNVISFSKSKEAVHQHLIDSNNSSSYCDFGYYRHKNARTEWHSTIPDT